MDKLNEARKSINEIDREMARLFEKRMQAAEIVAEHKRSTGMPIYDAKREEEVIRNNAGVIQNSTYREYYINFITDVMKLSRAYQTRLLDGMRIAYSGTEGAFAHIAAGKIFQCGERIPYGNFRDAYDSVVRGECDCAVLPLENSYAGEVGQTIDMMFSGPLYVKGVYDLPVIHDLVGIKGTDKSKIKKVISHPQALSQCAEYLRRNRYEQIQNENTAMAAKHVAESKDEAIAAICSAECAELFGLVTLDRHINESRINTTRFGVFSRAVPEHTVGRGSSEDGFILMFTVRNEAGSLAKAINIIGSHDYNMSTLRSRPMKELLWNYYFYVECDGSFGDDGERMVRELSSCCDKLKVAGIYRKKQLS